MTAKKMMKQSCKKIANCLRNCFYFGITTEDKRRQRRRRITTSIALIHDLAANLIPNYQVLARIVPIRISKIFCSTINTFSSHSWRLFGKIRNGILRRRPWKKEITSIDPAQLPRQGSKEITRTDLAQLPPELLFKIMAKMNLSVCSMVKTFPRSWLSIMTHPLFQTSRDHPHPSVSFIIHDTSVSNKFNLVQKDITSDTFDSIRLGHPGGYVSLDEWDCCNGLMYRAVHDASSKISFYLCNPLTSEWVRLPDPPNPPPEIRTHIEYFGFGYSANTNQYKVIRISSHVHRLIEDWGNLDNYHLYVDVYTIGTPAWRRIEDDTPFQILLTNNYGFVLPVEFKGVIHWLYTSDGFNYQAFCFDIETEQLGSFPLPNYGDDVYFRQIGVLNGYFVTCAEGDPWGVMKIWMLKDYNIKTSWVKLGDYHSDSDWITDFIDIDEDGKKVLVADDAKVCYRFEAKTKRLDNLNEVCGIIRDELIIRPFVTSFLSPKRIMQLDEQVQ